MRHVDALCSRRPTHLLGLDPFTGEFEDFEWQPGICYGKGSGGGTNTVTSSSSPPPQVLAAYQSAINAAQSAASAPLQQYSGATVAGFSPDQLSAFGTIDASQGIQQPFIQNANSAIGAAQTPLWGSTQQFSPSAVQQYTSPYTQNVLNTTMAAEQNQDAQQQTALQGNAISSGAWGGDRAGVASAILSGQQDVANNATNANIENTGYNTGLSEFNTEQQGQLGANEANSYLNAQAGSLYGALGTEAQNTALTGANAQEASGALQQTLGQEELNVPYENFLQQQAYPFQTSSFFTNAVEGTGALEGGTSSTTSPAASSVSQDVGLGLGGLGLLAAPIRTNAATGASTSLLGMLFAARGGKVPPQYPRGGVVNAARKYDAGGQVYNPGQPFGIPAGVPDVDVSVVPQAQNSVHGSGPPKPPPEYKPPSGAGGMGGTGLSMGQLQQIGSNLAGLNFGSPGGNPTGGSEGLALADPNANDMLPRSEGESLADGRDWRRGRRTGFDTGGGVGGQTPGTAAQSGQQVPTISGALNAMTPQQLQNYMMRVPPGTPQAQQLQQIINQKKMMPNVGQAAQGGFGTQQAPGNMSGGAAPQPQGAFAAGGRSHYDDGGDIPVPSIDQIQSVENSADSAPSDIPPVSASALQPPGAMGSGSAGAGNAPVSAPSTRGGTYDDAMIKRLQNRAPAEASPWLALANAGFAMAAGNSPRAAQNIGAGALAGINNYEGQMKQANDVNAAADKLLDEAQTHKAQIANETQREGDLQDYRQSDLGLKTAQLKQKELIKDSFGNPIGWADPTTGRIVPFQGQNSPGHPSGVPAMLSSAAQPAITSIGGNPVSQPPTTGTTSALPDDAQQRLQQIAPNPKDQALILGLIQGRIAPNRQSLGANPQAYIAAAADVDPTFDAANPTSRMKTAAAYSPGGTQGQLITSLNTASRHAAADALAGIDLNNADGGILDPTATLRNHAENAYLTASGDPRITTFQNVNHNYGTEAAKIITGKTNVAEEEIKQHAADIPENGSPRQILAAISTKNGLMLSKAQEMQTARDQAMGPYGMQQSVIQPEALQAFKDIDVLKEAANNGNLNSPEALAAKQRLKTYAAPSLQRAQQMTDSKIPPAPQRTPGQSYSTPKGQMFWGTDGKWYSPQEWQQINPQGAP